MRLADQLCRKGKCKSGLLLLVEYSPDGRPSAFEVADDKLRELVQQVCQSRSLTELYLDWDIAQKRKKSQSGRQVRSQAAFQRWLQSLDYAAPLIKALTQAQRSEVVEKLEDLLRVLKSENDDTQQ
jgi:hypothetical protein